MQVENEDLYFLYIYITVFEKNIEKDARDSHQVKVVIFNHVLFQTFKKGSLFLRGERCIFLAHLRTSSSFRRHVYHSFNLHESRLFFNMTSCI